MKYSVAIIGAGLIGRKRACALSSFDNCSLTAVADINKDRARALAAEFGGEAQTDWKHIVERKDIDIVIIATINKALLPIAVAALRNGKHTLCEKPFGRNSKESGQIIAAAKDGKAIVKTGFNHRYHPAISHAKLASDRGEIGKPYQFRCRYGHGGRPGHETEWRANKDLSGGGELLDQGVHVADLFRWFGGDFDEAFGCVATYHCDMAVEDNAFAMFKKQNGVIATMHTSWTQWKNLFSFEMFGSNGYLTIDGLGGSYGIETLTIGKRRPESGPPAEEVMTFPGSDISWEKEWKEFLLAIEEKREPSGSGRDGYLANKMIEAVYESSRTGKVVRITQ